MFIEQVQCRVALRRLATTRLALARAASEGAVCLIRKDQAWIGRFIGFDCCLSSLSDEDGDLDGNWDANLQEARLHSASAV